MGGAGHRAGPPVTSIANPFTPRLRGSIERVEPEGLGLLTECNHKDYNTEVVIGPSKGGTAVRTRLTGIREAKAQLSRLLRDVQRGREWIITDHGKPVARLVPASGPDLPLAERLRKLEELGLIEPERGDVRDLPPPLPLKDDLAQTWLQEDRNS